MDDPPKKLYDYDKLIAESDGLYRQWWELWKRIHPEWALIPEEPKEPEIKIPPKPKATFTPLSGKRCNHTWTLRSKEPPVQYRNGTHPIEIGRGRRYDLALPEAGNIVTFK